MEEKMADFDQIPFSDVTFSENPEKRCPVVLLLDTSGSMSGAKINELNNGLTVFTNELRADALAAKRVEVAIITFGPVQIQQYFETIDAFNPPTLSASGDTPMGKAISEAVNLIADRKKTYRSNGIDYFRPWIFMITDGAPTDDVTSASAIIKEGEQSKSFMFFSVGVDSADMNCLKQISVREPLKLKGISFRELFVWLSNSLSNVSASQPGEIVSLVNPKAPNGWAVAD
jgi:uncharacterized protein YegL